MAKLNIIFIFTNWCIINLKLRIGVYSLAQNESFISICGAGPLPGTYHIALPLALFIFKLKFIFFFCCVFPKMPDYSFQRYTVPSESFHTHSHFFTFFLQFRVMLKSFEIFFPTSIYSQYPIMRVKTEF